MSSRIQVFAGESRMVFGISMSPEHGIRVTESAASRSWRILDEKWADVLPNDLLSLIHI